jgi:GDP-L-fucose synthase
VFNIASGRDYTIAELAQIVKKTIGFDGNIVFDVSKPEGVLVKMQDISKISSLGWKYSTDLEVGIQQAYVAIPTSGFPSKMG